MRFVTASRTVVPILVVEFPRRRRERGVLVSCEVVMRPTSQEPHQTDRVTTRVFLQPSDLPLATESGCVLSAQEWSITIRTPIRSSFCDHGKLPLRLPPHRSSADRSRTMPICKCKRRGLLNNRARYRGKCLPGWPRYKQTSPAHAGLIRWALSRWTTSGKRCGDWLAAATLAGRQQCS